jgi:hypothetical protein
MRIKNKIISYNKDHNQLDLYFEYSDDESEVIVFSCDDIHPTNKDLNVLDEMIQDMDINMIDEGDSMLLEDENEINFYEVDLFFRSNCFAMTMYSLMFGFKG